MGTTSKGYRYPDSTDAPDGAAQIQDLAEDVDATPGVSVLSYAAIAALTGADLWTGRTVYQTNTGTDRPTIGIYTYNGVNWRKPWNNNWGKVARTVDNATATFTDASEHTISAAACTFTAVDNRQYRITASGLFRQADSVARSCTLKIKDNTTLIEDARIAVIPAGSDLLCSFFVESTLSAGSHTINVTMQSSNAAGMSCLGGNWPMLVYVEDVGPNGSPS